MDGGLLPVTLQGLGGAVLLAARVGGLMLVAPILSSRVIPTQIRVTILLMLTVALQPIAAGAAVPVTPGAILSETVTGFVLGLGAAVFVAAAETAGEWMAVQMGLAGATTLNPLSFESTPALGNAMGVIALILLLSVDAHLVMLEAVAASVDAHALGAVLHWDTPNTALVLGGTLFTQGLRFAAPVVGVLLLANVALGILARTVPQLNLLLVAFPVQIGVGLTVLGLSLHLVGTAFTSWSTGYQGVLDGMLEPLVGVR